MDRIDQKEPNSAECTVTIELYLFLRELHEWKSLVARLQQFVGKSGKIELRCVCASRSFFVGVCV